MRIYDMKPNQMKRFFKTAKRYWNSFLSIVFVENNFMEPNQFNPTPEQIDKIKETNKSLHDFERICYKCGHKACPSCLDWCDVVMTDITTQGNWDELDVEDVDENGHVAPGHACCDMSCSY
jgi:hypothetical protein